MKKLLSILVAAFLFTGINAQQLDEDFSGDDFPPEGWEVNNGSSSYGWKKGTAGGEVCALVPQCYGYENWLITPELKPANGEKLTFSARIHENTASGKLAIGISLSGTDKDSFSEIATFSCSSKADDSQRLWLEWHDFTIDLSEYKGQRIFIAFHQSGEIGNGGLGVTNVRGVSMAGSTSCENPTNLKVTELTNESATITWSGSADQYEYLLVEKGDEPDWSDAIMTTEKTVTFTDLYEESAFDFYVRSVCGSETSLAPKISFKTTCALQDVPWLETFTRDATGVVEPECWTVSSNNPQVWVVADKTYDDDGNATTVYGQAHLYAVGGGSNNAQVFAMPAFNAKLNTLEVAFDYRTNIVSDNYAMLEVGYMTNPSKASTFVSLKTLPQTLTYKHEICSLEDLPDDAKFIAFRWAGGTSDLGGLSMDNFVVAEIGKSGEVDPSQEEVPDAAIWGLSYCEAQFTWYSYNAEAFAIGLFDSESQQLVAGIACTTGECDRFAYVDGVAFSEDDDYENHYYCSTKWILNVDEDGISKGDAWENCVINVGTTATPQLGLKAGKYQVQVYALVQTSSGYSKGDNLATINFELVSKEVTNLKAEVAKDKKTATLTWDQPTLSTGERLYVDIRSGETIAYNNYDDSKQKAVSPLTVDVIEGNTYTAYVQIIDKNKNPLGAEVVCNFTVGVNDYEPKNPHAEVFGGDNVTFTWDATELADAYQIALYADGEYYSTLTVHGTEKTTTMPKDATWTWTVQAFYIGTNGNYYEASMPVEGNSFVSKAADVPEDAVVLNVAEMDAFYIEPTNHYYQEGKNAWIVQFATGEEDAPGYPLVWLLVYTAKEAALSGVYNVARGNLDLESTLFIPEAGNGDASMLATDAELRLTFDGLDEELFEQGYAYAYYTGMFRIVNKGITYIAKFMETKCNSFGYTNYETGNPLNHVGMWDEDYTTPEGVEQVLVEHGFDLQTPMYNIMGVQVDANYKGIVIQNGKKVMLQ